MIEKIYDKLRINALLIIMITLPSVKLIAYILYLTNIINDPFLIRHVAVLWMMIPVLLFLYLYGLFKKKNSFNYLDIINILLIILAGVSTIFAVKVKISIWGETRRNEGLLSLISYYLIFLNTKNIKESSSKERLIKIFMYLGLFQVFYSIIQIYTDWGIVKRHGIPYLATGLCGNPNFLASYMSMLVMLTATMYIKNADKKYLLLVTIFNVGLTLAETSGPFLAVIISLIFVMIFFHKKEFIKRTLLVSLVLICSFFLTTESSIFVQEKLYKNEIKTQYNIGKELIYSFKHISSVKKENIKTDDTIGNGRLRIWSNLIPKVKDYWLVGAGIDNIAHIYPQNGHTIVDKAHNVYLQILITNGLPALILYCFLCLTIFIKGFKLKNDDIPLYMLFVVYSIQAFANISVIDVAPYFFLFFGLLASNFNEKLFKKGIIKKQITNVI